MGGSPGEIRHKLADALSQYVQIATIQAVIGDNTWQSVARQGSSLKSWCHEFYWDPVS